MICGAAPIASSSAVSFELAGEADHARDVLQRRRLGDGGGAAERRAHDEDVRGAEGVRRVDRCLEVLRVAVVDRERRGGRWRIAAQVDRDRQEAVRGQPAHGRQPAAQPGAAGLVQQDDRARAVPAAAA